MCLVCNFAWTNKLFVLFSSFYLPTTHNSQFISLHKMYLIVLTIEFEMNFVFMMRCHVRFQYVPRLFPTLDMLFWMQYRNIWAIQHFWNRPLYRNIPIKWIRWIQIQIDLLNGTFSDQRFNTIYRPHTTMLLNGCSSMHLYIELKTILVHHANLHNI